MLAYATFATLDLFCCVIVLVFLPPKGGRGCLMSPPVWNLRAVTWFHFAIVSLVLLSSPVTLSILSFSACWSFLLNFFRKIFQYFSLTDRLFLYDSCLAARRSKFVVGVCCMLPYGNGVCCYAFINFFFFFIASVHAFFKLLFNLVLINRQNGPRYQRVLVLSAFLTGVVLKGLIFRKFCDRCLCIFF